MSHRPSTAFIQEQIAAQIGLADLAAAEDIRAMHRDLEQLYRTQLIALLLVEELSLQPARVPDWPAGFGASNCPACGAYDCRAAA